jgi:hypothetical protein
MDYTDDISDALYAALDTLEELDPSATQEPWFQLIQKTVDGAVKSRIEKVDPTQHCVNRGTLGPGDGVCAWRCDVRFVLEAAPRAVMPYWQLTTHLSHQPTYPILPDSVYPCTGLIPGR